MKTVNLRPEFIERFLFFIAGNDSAGVLLLLLLLLLLVFVVVLVEDAADVDRLIFIYEEIIVYSFSVFQIGAILANARPCHWQRLGSNERPLCRSETIFH